MKTITKYFLLLFFFIPVVCFSQDSKQINWIVVDSTLYKNNAFIPPYPYQAQYDSLNKILKAQSDSARSVSPNSVIDYFLPHPKVYVELENGKRVDPSTYHEMIKSELPDSLFCLIFFTIQWNGVISEIKLNRYRKPLNKSADLMKYLIHFKAEPAKEDGIILPFVSRYSYLLRK